MIIKEKEAKNYTSKQLKAGDKQETDVAFYLRREYKDDKKVFIFNDLKLSYNGENAQIDHLILFPYGFALLESKSISGEVKINQEREWMRSYNGKWSGMASPIQQVELQKKLLINLLCDNAEKMLGKLMGIQANFGGREYETLCCVSSNAILHRDNMPKGISNKVVKNEFIIERLEEKMKIKNKLGNLLSARLIFIDQSINNICNFLLEEDKKNRNPHQVNKKVELIKKEKEISKPTPVIKKEIPVSPPKEIDNSITDLKMVCKKCKTDTVVSPKYGKHGYYFECNDCNTNTAMKYSCPQCENKKPKVSKKKAVYSLNCSECEFVGEIKYREGV